MLFFVSQMDSTCQVASMFTFWLFLKSPLERGFRGVSSWAFKPSVFPHSG